MRNFFFLGLIWTIYNFFFLFKIDKRLQFFVAFCKFEFLLILKKLNEILLIICKYKRKSLRTAEVSQKKWKKKLLFWSLKSAK